MGELLAINISTQKGTVKHPVPAATLLPDYGIEGDAHAGGWHRQVSLLAEESVEEMRARGVEGLTHGIFAENLTTKGIELFTLPVGTLLRVGAAVLEVTQIGKECHKGCEIFKKAGMCVMPTKGIFARVRTGGVIQPGDVVDILL